MQRAAGRAAAGTAAKRTSMLYIAPHPPLVSATRMDAHRMPAAILSAIVRSASLPASTAAAGVLRPRRSSIGRHVKAPSVTGLKSAAPAARSMAAAVYGVHAACWCVDEYWARVLPPA